jgi:hypothetical protein
VNRRSTESVFNKEPGVKNRSIWAVTACSFLLSLSPLAADPAIPRGIDAFNTPADGKTYYDFAQNPIPAGFFCKGSKAFSGRVALKGVPLATGAPGELRGADTVVERLDDAVFDARGTAVTRLQFRALSLASIAPVKTGCGAFHVYVSLAGEQRVTAMSIHRTKENGGTFVAPLAVDARMTFIPVKPRAKGAGKLELTGRFTFPASSLAWSLTDGAAAKRASSVVVDTNGDLTPDTRLLNTSRFLAGLSPDRPTQNKWRPPNCCHPGPVCHAAEGHEHCWEPMLPPECPYWTLCAE